MSGEIIGKYFALQALAELCADNALWYTTADLAEYLEIKVDAARSLLWRLWKQKLAARVRDPDHPNRYAYRPTRKGRAWLERRRYAYEPDEEDVFDEEF